MHSNIRKGLSVGLSLGVVYALVAGGIFALAGAPGRIAGGYILMYLAGGIVGGVLAGALLPFSQSLGGAFLVGMVGALPFFLLVGFMIVLVEDEPAFIGVLVGVISAFLLGGPLGIYYLHSDSETQ